MRVKEDPAPRQPTPKTRAPYHAHPQVPARGRKSLGSPAQRLLRCASLDCSLLSHAFAAPFVCSRSHRPLSRRRRRRRRPPPQPRCWRPDSYHHLTGSRTTSPNRCTANLRTPQTSTHLDSCTSRKTDRLRHSFTKRTNYSLSHVRYDIVIARISSAATYCCRPSHRPKKSPLTLPPVTQPSHRQRHFTTSRLLDIHTKRH